MAQLSLCRRQTFTYAEYLPPTSPEVPSLGAAEELHRGVSVGLDHRIISTDVRLRKLLIYRSILMSTRLPDFATVQHLYAHTSS